MFSFSGQGQVWFGGTDQAEEGTWMFTDGTVIDYFGTGWVESGGVNENCARFQPAPWDIHCSSQFKYICMTSPAQGKTTENQYRFRQTYSRRDHNFKY